MFTLTKKDKTTKARRGQLQTAHGVIETPFFMPVGTNGTVKSLTFENLHDAGAQIMLSNTYHLTLRPGMDVMKSAGGLHRFTGWPKPILTDSGGYQVFSLAKLRKITDEGVEFRSHLDGTAYQFTPEKVVEIQSIIGSDMMMPLDECSPYPCPYDQALEGVVRTTLWAKRSRAYYQNYIDPQAQKLFGIIQGSTYKDLRQRSAEEILAIGFDGYAIGGVSVGETIGEMFGALDWVMPFLPDNKPRYFMGIGLPDQMVKAVGEGIDMFDTVLPTRLGRHATAFTRQGRIILRNKEHAQDFGPMDPQCDNICCQKYSRAYIRHLCSQNEISGLTLVSFHNICFYLKLMKDIRAAIEEGRYAEFEKAFLKEYKSGLFEM